MSEDGKEKEKKEKTRRRFQVNGFPPYTLSHPLQAESETWMEDGPVPYAQPPGAFLSVLSTSSLFSFLCCLSFTSGTGGSRAGIMAPLLLLGFTLFVSMKNDANYGDNTEFIR